MQMSPQPKADTFSTGGAANARVHGKTAAMVKSAHLRGFLQSARNIRNSGGATDELSYYSAFSVLLNGIGDALKPIVMAVMEMKDSGAGFPDGYRVASGYLRRERMLRGAC